MLDPDEKNADPQPCRQSHLIVGEHGLLDCAELLEVGLDVLQAGGGGQAAHEYLLCPHHQLRVGLTRHRHLRHRTEYNFPRLHQLYFFSFKKANGYIKNLKRCFGHQ
jgi:hypothetical protein